MKRRAFSLMEMTAVLVILAIAAAAVVLRLEGPMRRAQMRDVIGMIAQFDHLTRVHAREHDRPLRLVVDLNGGELGRTDEHGNQAVGAPLRLSSDYTIARLMIREEEISAGTAAVSCSRRGLTPSYAMLLEGKGGRRQWIVLAGLTGTLVKIENEEEILDIFAATGLRRNAG